MLWPHQAADIAAFERERGYRQRLCLVRPTGMGKTRTMRELAVRELERGGRVVIYTHRKLLIDQLFRTFDDAGIECGIRAAGYGKNDDALVQIVSTQTESSRTLRTPRKIAALRKKAEQVDDLAESVKTAAEIARLSAKNHGRASGSLVIVDEAHVQKGLEIRELVNRHVAEEATILGVTATPVDLEDLYEGIIGNGYTSEGRSCGALVQAVHYAPDEPDMRRFAKWTPGDELTERQAEKAIIRDGVIGRVSKWYRKTNPEQKPSILFGPSVNGSQWFAEELSKSGIRSAHLDGENCWLDGKLYPSDRKAREEIIEMSRTGDVKILCNRFVLREGVDCPWLEHGILATVFGGVSTYLQSGGRLLRASPSTGKTTCTIQDHGGNWWRHGSLNADRDWTLGDTSRMVAARREAGMRKPKAPHEAEPFLCPACKRTWLSGRVCSCGHTLTGAKSREVTQHDGRLVKVEGSALPPRKEKEEPDTAKKWERVFWAARKSDEGRTFRQARSVFFYHHGYWPPDTLPLMPLDEGDWFKRVRDVPFERLRPKEK